MRLSVLWLAVIMTLCCAGVCSAALTISVQAQGYQPCTPGSGVTCPAGDMGWYVVKVQETPPVPGNPIICTANGPFAFRPGQNPQTIPQDARGNASFTFINMGGCGNVTFTAVSTTSPPVGPSPPIYNASPDSNADCLVSLIDFVVFAQSYMTANPCCDYDCDGMVALSDFIMFAAHYTHFC